MTEFGLSIGSNLGNRISNLREAASRINALPGTVITARSGIYETAPVGVQPQYRHLAYFNAVLIVNSTLTSDEFAKRLHAIEAAMGRIRTEDRFAPRTIDIDVLYAGGEIRADEDLTLPHPRWAERRFVLQPLADVRPDMIFPGSRQRVANILSSLPGQSDVIPVNDNW